MNWVLIDPTFDIRKIKSEGKTIGSGAFGNVKELITSDGRTNKYTMKTQKINDINNKYTFNNELKVGSNQKLQKNFIGPYIYAYSTYKKGNQKYGAYIMDHWERGLDNVKSSTLLDFLNKHKKSCPLPNSDLINRLEHLLLSFYKITKGYHGDLHSNNIAVVTDSKNNILFLQIYDYGAHKKFRNTQKFDKCSTLIDLFKLIKSEFNENTKQIFNGVYFPPNTKTKVLYPNVGQPYRSNTNVLKFVNKFKGSSKEKGISLYNSLLKNSNLMKKLNIVKKIANISNEGIIVKPKYNELLNSIEKQKMTKLNNDIHLLNNMVNSVMKRSKKY